MDLEFGQDSSIDPIISQEAGLKMSELGGNPNHNDSRDSISSNPQLKASINQIMDKAKINELHYLQEFKNQLDDILNINEFTVGTGKSLSEALIFASTNPQYDDRLFIELQVQYMKIPSSNLGRTCCRNTWNSSYKYVPNT